MCCDGGDAAASGPEGQYKLIIVNQNATADTHDDCTLQSKQPWMHASYGLVKTRLICYMGKMRMFTRIGIRIIPVVTSAHLHIRIIPPAVSVYWHLCKCQYHPPFFKTPA